MEGMKHFNPGDANEELAKKEEARILHDSVTAGEERLANITERGKELLLKDLKSQEFNLLTVLDTGTREETETTFKTYSILVNQYEEKYGHYQTQLSTTDGVAHYIEELTANPHKTKKEGVPEELTA
jgi:hypothetical protein